MNGFVTLLIANLREHSRRRTAHVALVLGLLFVALFTVGTHFIWAEIQEEIQSGRASADQRNEAKELIPATLFGLSMFATWFLSAVAATFLAAGGIRGEAERGVLQHVIVRPVARATVLVARLVAAAILALAFLLGVISCCALATSVITGWTPANIVPALLLLGLGTATLTSFAAACSVRLHGAAAGIVTLMLFGVGLLGGLLEQIGVGAKIDSLRVWGRWVSTALPFEAMYQAALDVITNDIPGVTGVVVRLGPFGGARHASAALILWAIAWSSTVVSVGAWRLRKRDF